MEASGNNKAILFADLSGSSALYKKSGNQVAKEMVDLLLMPLKQIALENNGRIVKSIGDEIMTCFDSAMQAFYAASQMQLSFSKLFCEQGFQLNIGIGFGETILDADDLFGEAVNDAAYLTGLAKGGQILITQSTCDELDEYARLNIALFDTIAIKGARHEANIYRVFWQAQQGSETETRLMSAELLDKKLSEQKLTLVYQGEAIIIGVEQTPFLMGRDVFKCDLVVDAQQVSREHCVIKFNRGKFVLIDHSTNGTFVTPKNRDEFYIRREEYPLVGSTKVSLGVSKNNNAEHTLYLEF